MLEKTSRGVIDVVVLMGLAVTSVATLALLPHAPATQLPVEQSPAPTKAVLSVTSENSNITVNRIQIVKINDNATIDVFIDGKEQTLSLLGLTTKETSACSENDTDSLDLTNKPAFFVKDPMLPDTPTHTALGYIFFEDGTLVNEMLLRKGIGAINDIPQDALYKKELEKAEALAQDEKLGLWSDPCPTLTGLKTKQNATTVSVTPTPLLEKILGAQIVPLHPTATPTQTPTPQPAASLQSQPGSLSSDTIFLLINLHRKNLGLAAFEKDEKLCSIAASRGPELYNEIFGSSSVHKGFYDRNIPFWITENMAHYGSEDAIVNWWLGSGIHRRAIESDAKYSCGACVGNSCAQLFTSWVPK